MQITFLMVTSTQNTRNRYFSNYNIGYLACMLHFLKENIRKHIKIIKYRICHDKICMLSYVTPCIKSIHPDCCLTFCHIWYPYSITFPKIYNYVQFTLVFLDKFMGILICVEYPIGNTCNASASSASAPHPPWTF